MNQSKTSLLRQLGLVSATALVISNMVGTGIFTTTGFLAGDLGDPSIVLGIWVVGAIVALAGAFCYSELGINFPSSGGEYVYLTEAYGPTWGFMEGWISFTAGFSAPIALAALAFSDYLGYFFPAVKLSVIVGFLVFAFAIGKGDWGNFSQVAVRTATSPLWEQFATSLIFIYVAYSGWNAATYVAEELRSPERTLPLALTLGTTLVAALFVGLNVAYIYAQPLEQMKGVVAVGSLSASNLFGPEVASLFSGLMAVSLLATVNAMVTIGPRVYYAMAQNKAFFPAAARVHERWRTPYVAIAMQGACAVAMCFLSFRDLMFYVGFLLNAFSVLAVASLFVFRKRAGWQRVGVVDFAWPLVPAFYVLVGAWVAGSGFLMRPGVSAAALGTVVVGAFAYKIFLAPKAVAS